MSARRRRLIAPLLSLVLVACGATTHAANPDAVRLLLSHIPPAIAATCTVVEPSDTSQQAQVGCQPAGSNAGAVYVLYNDNAAMDGAFDAHLATFPDATGTDCSAGPGSGSYTLDGTAIGRIFCDVASDHAFVEWTDIRFSILAKGTSASTDFAALNAWWANEAGPILGNGVPAPTPSSSGGQPTAAARTPAGTPTEGSSSGPKVSGTPVSRVTGASIHEVVFATSIDATTGSPIGIADAFRTATPTIYALVAWDVIEVGTTLDVKLFQGDRLISEKNVVPNHPNPKQTTVDTDGGFAIPFSPDGGFQAGSYAVELDYHDLPEEVASFEVNETGDGAPLPGNGSLGPSGTSTDLGPVPYADPAGVLVVTRSSILRQHLGADTDAVLAAAAKVGTVHDLTADLGDNTRPVPAAATIQLVKGLLKAGAYKYLLIIGGDDAVPMGHITLPDSVDYSSEISGEGIPGNYVVSDDPYVNTDGDKLETPDLAVARIPTSDDAQLLLTQLGDNQPKPVGAFSLVNEVRRSLADGPLTVVNAITPVTLYYSPPTVTAQIPQTNEANARFIYILLHGDGSKTDTWWGEIQKWTALTAGDPLSEYTHAEDNYSNGLTVPSAGAPGAIVNVGACFGAYTLDSPLGDTHKTRDNSLALKFLAAGSRTFIADTYISESSNVDPGDTPRARTGFEILLWQAVQGGASPIDAFFSAKSQYATMIKQLYASGDSKDALAGDTNFLALHEMTYLGRP